MKTFNEMHGNNNKNLKKCCLSFNIIGFVMLFSAECLFLSLEVCLLTEKEVVAFSSLAFTGVIRVTDYYQPRPGNEGYASSPRCQY